MKYSESIDALRATVVNPNSWYVPSSMDRNVFSMSFQGGYYAAAGITTTVAITDLAVAGYRGVSGLSRSGRGVSGIGGKGMYGVENALKIGKYKYTNTAGSHITDLVKRGPFRGELSRPYMKSAHTVNEIMAAGKPVPDTGGIPGGLRLDVPGTFRGSEGSWELVFHPENKVIYHFNFK